MPAKSDIEMSLRAEHLFDLSEISFSDLLGPAESVWESLRNRDAYIRRHLESNTDLMMRSDITLEGDVAIGEGTVIEAGAYIKGPSIIGKHCEIRHGAYIRGNVIAGDHCVIGHTTEVIRSILLNHVRADHFAYIGDSILGNNCHLGAGVILANIKMRMNASTVRIKFNGHSHDTGMRKLGSILGDNTEIGCNSVLNPGTVFEKGVAGYPGTVFRGHYAAGNLVKTTRLDEKSRPMASVGGDDTDRLEKIGCPTCGEQIRNIGKVKEMIRYCKEFRGQCSCGQKYSFQRSLPEDVILSFPDRQIEIVC